MAYLSYNTQNQFIWLPDTQVHMSYYNNFASVGVFWRQYKFNILIL